jgi:hypothetical protein
MRDERRGSGERKEEEMRGVKDLELADLSQKVS